MKLSFLLMLLLPLLSFSQLITKIESLQSLYIECWKDSTKLGSATGYVIHSKTQNYLVTNWHVVTDKNPVNQQWLDAKIPVSPNKLLIGQRAKVLGNNYVETEYLYNADGSKRWHENTVGSQMVDVVELPLLDTGRATVYPVNYQNGFDSISCFSRQTDCLFWGIH